MNITKTQLLKSAGLIITGLLLGWLIFSGSSGDMNHADHDQLNPEEMDQHVTEEHSDEEGNIVYTCSMHPSVRENEPGNCPICGMELIPVSDTDDRPETDDYSMVMTQASMQLANIQTTAVIRERPKREIHLPGRVSVDERRISYVTAHFEGRVQNVQIDYTGATISEGEVMATIYSPELVSAQRELLEAVKVRDRNPGLYESAVRKFRLWEFTDEQIQRIVERGEVQRNMEMLSPVDGFVMKRNVVDEQHVMEGTVIYEVANLDQLWVTLDAYEGDLEWLSEGSAIEFKTRSNSDRTYQATVDYIDPTFNSQTRTIRIRADVENEDHSLRPDMLVSGIVNSEMSEEKLMVPASAVLWTGPRSLVYVKDPSADSPRFEVKEVELGPRTGDHYVIENGLDEGQEVVFNGSFRVDSEFQLADKFSMMNREPGSGAVPEGHQHVGMDMDDSEMEEEDHSEHQQSQQIDASQDTSHSHDEHLGILVTEYLKVKDALAADDFDTAVNDLETFSEEVTTSSEMNDHEEHSAMHEVHHGNMVAAVNEAGEAENLEELRAAFKNISTELITAVENQGYEGLLFVQYCPMYQDGSTWLSDSEEIENPYYGSQMLDCGEVIERIDR